MIRYDLAIYFVLINNDIMAISLDLIVFFYEFVFAYVKERERDRERAEYKNSTLI